MELWDVYTKDRQKTGRTHLRGSVPQMAEGDYHIVIDVWTFLPDGRLLVTQRDPIKPHGLLWEATGGSITEGETSRIGAVREVEEEVGLHINPDDLVLVGEWIKTDSLIDVYVTRLPHMIEIEDLTYQIGEVINAKFVSKQEFFEMDEQKLLTANMRQRYENHRELMDEYFQPEPNFLSPGLVSKEK